MRISTSNASRLKADLRNVAHDIERVLHNMSEAAEDRTGNLRLRARERLSSARDRLDDLGHGAALRAREVGGRTQHYVHENPWRVLGAAVATAYLVGWLMRSRR